LPVAAEAADADVVELAEAVEGAGAAAVAAIPVAMGDAVAVLTAIRNRKRVAESELSALRAQRVLRRRGTHQ
jgi:hypothetical protein